MSQHHLFRFAAIPEQPWKNGGGTTREIAAFPPQASLDDFTWRLSMARVAVAGPFSSFTGIDRVLAVLEGALQLDGPTIAARLDPASDPFPFDGGAACAGEPLDGAVLDLNAMARRDRCRIAMHRLATGDEAAPEGASFVVALEPQTIAGEAMDRFDCLQLGGPVRVAGRAILVHFVSG